MGILRPPFTIFETRAGEVSAALALPFGSLSITAAATVTPAGIVVDPANYSDGIIADFVYWGGGLYIGKSQANRPNQFCTVDGAGAYADWFNARGMYDTAFSSQANSKLNVKGKLNTSGDVWSVYWNATSNGSSFEEFRINTSGGWEHNYQTGGRTSGSGLSISLGTEFTVTLDASAGTSVVIKYNGGSALPTSGTGTAGLYWGVLQAATATHGVIHVETIS